MRPARLPRIFWTIDDYQVDLDSDWSASETVNLGFDQFRGRIMPTSAHGLPWTVGIGSIVTGRTDDGVVIWEGAISAPLQIEVNEWVRVAAQGFAYESAKLADRFPMLVTAAEAWTVGNATPLNFPQTAQDQPTVTATKTNNPPYASSFANNVVSIDFTLANDVSIAFWARNANITRFAGHIGSGANAAKLYAARGPDIYASAREFGVFAPTAQTTGYLDVDIPPGYDALVVRWQFTSATTGTGTLVAPRTWSDTTRNALRAPHIAAGIGEHLGWDTARVQDIGVAVFPSFDWGSDASGALGQAVGPDDLVWQVRERQGVKPRLELRRWSERSYTVAGNTGAEWNLERMERYNRVTAQYLDVTGQVRTVTVDADPDPLNGRGIKEALVTLGGLVPIDTTVNGPTVLAEAALSALSAQRYRGDITSAYVYSDLGRLATYEVRAGDEVRISDFSKLDGALTDRIAAVSKGAGGISMTLEPAAIAGSSLSGASGGVTPGTLLPPTNLPAYVPPGTEGTTTPKTGAELWDLTHPPDILF